MTFYQNLCTKHLVAGELQYTGPLAFEPICRLVLTGILMDETGSTQWPWACILAPSHGCRDAGMVSRREGVDPG
jgi:hypothetical protein